MGISEEKMKIVINNYFKSECDVNTSIREAFEKGFRIGVKKGLAQSKADTPQTDSHITCYGICTDKCGAYENGDCILNAKKADTPQTDYPCNTCANKGDHDGECKNCVADSAPIRWKTPSHYKPKQTDCPWK